MKRTKSVIETYGMRINIKKTKVMKIGRDSSAMSVMINGKELEQVEQLKYFGSILTSDAPVKFEQEWLWQKMPSARERNF